jgi:ABC-type lipoprotein release transport system permease subunit
MTSFFAMMRIGLLDLLHAWKINSVLAVLVAVTSMTYLALSAYKAGLDAAFPQVDAASLVVMQSNTTGEIAGSRISTKVGEQLQQMGIEMPVAEIHSVVGTSAKDAALLRGVDPSRYRQILVFEMESGSALLPDTPARQAMLGWRMAQRWGVGPGDLVRLRGRDFVVSGIFRMGTYADNEAWVSITDAQNLLGWGDEVSLYLIPGNRTLAAGMELPGGLSVARRGEGIKNDMRQSQDLIQLVHNIVWLVGITTAVFLATVLLRLAWLRRRNIAILRSIGFPRSGVAAYLLAQSAAVALAGSVVGLLGSFLLASRQPVSTLGLDILPVFDAKIILAWFAWTAGITLLGMLAPAVWFDRSEISLFLFRE